MITDLVAFLITRLNEVEAAAKAATPGPWIARPVIYGPAREGWGDPEDGPWNVEAGELGVVTHVMHEGGGADGTDARHIALNDPGRVLRGVAVKRAIIAKYELGRRVYNPETDDWFSPAAALFGSDMEWLIRMLGTEWSDHPGYQQKWAP